MKNEPRYGRYLEAKRKIDDESLNRRVFAKVRKNLPDRKLNVLEAGGGVGTMVRRVIEWDLLQKAEYVLVEKDSDLISYTSDYLEKLNRKSSILVRKNSTGGFSLKKLGKKISLKLKNLDVFEFLDHNFAEYDLIIANCFMDLVNIEKSLDKFLSTLSDGGIFYFTLNFDGVTIFRPENKYDDEIIRLYHNSMDEGSGSSETGRELIEAFTDKKCKLIGVGSSDWIVCPKNNRYNESERYFLSYILKTVKNALKEKNADFLDEWIKERYKQVENGKLIYIAHQIDIAGEK